MQQCAIESVSHMIVCVRMCITTYRTWHMPDSISGHNGGLVNLRQCAQTQVNQYTHTHHQCTHLHTYILTWGGATGKGGVGRRLLFLPGRA